MRPRLLAVLAAIAAPALGGALHWGLASAVQDSLPAKPAPPLRYHSPSPTPTQSPSFTASPSVTRTFTITPTLTATPSCGILVGLLPSVPALSLPRYVAYDALHDHVIVDRVNSCQVYIYTGQGAFIGRFGSNGTGPGQFYVVNGLATDSQGNIFVSDAWHNRIEIFSPSGSFLRQIIGSATATSGTIGTPYQFDLRGLAVDAAGEIFASDPVNSEVVKYDAAGNTLAVFGSNGNGNGQFDAPMGLALEPNGDLLVADYGNSRVQRLRANGTYLGQFSTSGEAMGSYNGPTGIAEDSTGLIYVVEDQRTLVYSHGGTFERAIGPPSRWQNEGVAAGPNRGLFVTDPDANLVGLYDSSHILLRSLGAPPQDGAFNEPHAAVADSAGNIYVADSLNYRIQKLGPQGNFLLKWGSSGTGNGQFMLPLGLAVDSGGDVYVADETTRIQIFDSSGSYLRQVNVTAGYFKSVAVDGSGNVYAIGEFGQGFDALGNLFNLGSPSSPGGVALYGGGLAMTDDMDDQVSLTNLSGQVLSTFGSSGSGPGQLSQPAGLAADGSGNLYVADRLNYRVEKFSSTGTYLGQSSGPGGSLGNYGGLPNVSMDPYGNLLVSDPMNDRIIRACPF